MIVGAQARMRGHEKNTRFVGFRCLKGESQELERLSKERLEWEKTRDAMSPKIGEEL